MNVIGLCKQGHLKEAIRVLKHADQHGIRVDGNVYVAFLRACTRTKSLEAGKLAHTLIAKNNKNGVVTDVVLANFLVGMYAKCGCLAEAECVFAEMRVRNVFSWTAMIAAYAHHGHPTRVLSTLRRMQGEGVKPDRVTFTTVVNACTKLDDVRLIHDEVIGAGVEPDIVLGNALIQAYAKCGSLELARCVFDDLRERDVVSWTTMVSAYCKHKCAEEAWQLFQRMSREGFHPNLITWNAMIAGCAQSGDGEQALKLLSEMRRSGVTPNVVTWTALITGCAHNGKPKEALQILCEMQQQQEEGVKANAVTFASAVKACAGLANLSEGKWIHAFVLASGCELDTFVGSSLIDMYSKCSRVADAMKVFARMPERTVVSWTAMVSGYARNGHIEEALVLFKEMQKTGITADAVSWTALVARCAQNGHVKEAFELFRQMQQKGVEMDIISWTALISGCVEHGHDAEALQLYLELREGGMKLDKCAFVGILKACAGLGALEEGRSVHEHAKVSGFGSEIMVRNALINMYSKCGSLSEAQGVFEGTTSGRDVVTWTAMIAGYALNGEGRKAVEVFEEMRAAGVEPVEITYTCVLSACSHGGLLEEGRRYFEEMASGESGVRLTAEHYACMVDLMGRAGHLEEAEGLIARATAFHDNAFVWTALLSACRSHGNVKLAERASARALALEPENTAAYVLLSNTYAESGHWEAADKVRKAMEARGLKKEAGRSWIVVGGRVHSFIAGDRSHPQRAEIDAELRKLTSLIKEAGYVPNTRFALHNVNEQQKEHSLCAHSERLAIAFGLISTPPSTTIRIRKNLRVCTDCHTATKYISKIVRREIIARDGNRFHHFKDGTCSCGDYW